MSLLVKAWRLLSAGFSWYGGVRLVCNANCAILWLHIFLHVIVDAGMQMLSLLVKAWRLQSGVAGISWYGGVRLSWACYVVVCWYSTVLYGIV